MDFEIFFSDLNEEAQRSLLEALGIDDPKEMNWDMDVFSVATFPIEEEEDMILQEQMQ